jgi:hypothetical protein
VSAAADLTASPAAATAAPAKNVRLSMRFSSVDIGLFAGCDRPRKKLCVERELKPSRNIEWDRGSSAFAFLLFVCFCFVAFAFLKNHDVAFPPWRVRHRMNEPTCCADMVVMAIARMTDISNSQSARAVIKGVTPRSNFFAMHTRDVATKRHREHRNPKYLRGRKPLGRFGEPT